VVAIGLLPGGAAALLGAGRVGPLLFEVGPRDPRVLGFAAVAVFVVAGLALLVPAWRAANVDPRETLD
jgi:ABC-type antimicrobial peptide transport system permease subunit